MKHIVKYPVFDRTDWKPQKHKKDRDDHIDVYQSENVFSDGRPYREECWAAYQMTFLSYYFSTKDIENYTTNELKNYLISQQVIEFDDDKFHYWGFQGENLSCRKITDKNENEFWECTVIIGDEDGVYVRTFNGKKLHSNEDEIQWDTEEQIWYRYIDQVCKDISNRVKWKLQRMHDTLSGDDSGLINVWEELCVQVQDEHSFFWERYVETILGIIRTEVQKLNENLKKLIWFSDESNWGASDDMEYDEEAVIEYIFYHILCSIAADYTNKRIEEYLYKDSDFFPY